MSYRVDASYSTQQWLKGKPSHVLSAYDGMVRQLASDPWRVGHPTRSSNMREYAFCVEGIATFVITDTHVTVTIVGVR
ncbi:hypothetical protein ACIBSV_48170 [Embleya sp. NPDC050154]|uniref:hypothetical protein n=1 Tax=unclassified Embleya TaxID=2699296 RepID=UPI0037AEA946